MMSHPSDLRALAETFSVGGEKNKLIFFKEGTPKQNLACFVCYLKINNTFLKIKIILKQIFWETQITILWAKRFLSYWSEQCFARFDQYLKNCMAYWNFNTIFEFLI